MNTWKTEVQVLVHAQTKVVANLLRPVHETLGLQYTSSQRTVHVSAAIRETSNSEACRVTITTARTEEAT